jgi:drug/metabolite transporter (DMT)-like permease
VIGLRVSVVDADVVAAVLAVVRLRALLRVAEATSHFLDCNRESRASPRGFLVYQRNRKDGGGRLSVLQQRTRWQRWWPFLLLMLAGASRWMLAGVRPEAESSVASEAAGCAWAALVFVVLLTRPFRGRPLIGSLLRSGLGGAMLLCGPAIGQVLHANRVESSGLMMALALTPVVVAIAGRTDEVAGRIWPGLATVAGLMLVLVQPNLGDARSDVALILAPLLTGCGAALLDSERNATVWQAPAALAGAGLVFAAGWAGTTWYFGGFILPSLSAVACDGVLALLSLLVLARLGAVRWSAQFALLPLLILLQGILILRPTITVRWVAGMLLIATASIYLLLPQAEETETRMTLR